MFGRVEGQYTTPGAYKRTEKKLIKKKNNKKQNQKENKKKGTVMMIPFVFGGLGTLIKDQKKRWLELGIRRRIDVILTTALIESAWILKSVLETQVNLYQENF